MISTINTEQKLALLFANHNKALAQVLNVATPEELKQIGTKLLELPTLLKTLLDATHSEEKSQKAILDVLKNHPTFKEMGTLSSDLKQLVTMLKEQPQTKEIQQFQKALQSFLMTLDKQEAKEPQNLKQMVQNSGIFLESKLTKIPQPNQDLKAILQTVESFVKTAPEPALKNFEKPIIQLLKEPFFQTPTQTDKPATFPPEVTQNIAKRVATLAQKLEVFIAKHDQVELPKTQTQQQQFTQQLAQLKQFVDDLPQAKQFQQPNILMAKTAIPDFEITKQQIDTMSKQFLQPLEKSLDSFQNILLQSRNEAAKPSLGLLDQLIDAIVSIKQSKKEVPKEAMTQLLSKGTQLDDQLSKMVPKDVPETLSKLEKFVQNLVPFTRSKQLQPSQVMQEHLSKDMKTQLLRLQEAISRQELGGDNIQPDLLKQVDKILLQVDYYQLNSYLTNANALYFPFEWNMLNEGSLSFKQGKKDKFFCHIDLNLEEYGQVKIMAALYQEKQLMLHFHTEKPELKQLISENLKLLRSALLATGLHVSDIRLFDLDKNSKEELPYHDDEAIDIGFKVIA